MKIDDDVDIEVGVKKVRVLIVDDSSANRFGGHSLAVPIVLLSYSLLATYPYPYPSE